MRLLLLLSALFAALSGATAQARTPQAGLVEIAARTVAPAAERAHAHVLLSAVPTGHVPERATAVPLPAFTPQAAPLWLHRRRE